MNEFDFLVGTWDVANRWLVDFVDERSGWEEFPAISRITRHLEGAANFEEIDFPTKGFSGLTLRLYDPDSQTWSLYWASKRTGKLFPPVIGTFVDERGEFYGEDTHNEQTVSVRIVWDEIANDTARFTQSYSADGGLTWLTNWTMHFSRRNGE